VRARSIPIFSAHTARREEAARRSNSGLHPSAGRKNASPEKLKAVSPAPLAKNSTKRCNVWRADTAHARGRAIKAFRGFSVEIPGVSAFPSQAARVHQNENAAGPEGATQVR